MGEGGVNRAIDRIAKMMCAADGPPGIGNYRWDGANETLRSLYRIKARAAVDVVIDELGLTVTEADPVISPTGMIYDPSGRYER